MNPSNPLAKQTNLAAIRLLCFGGAIITAWLVVLGGIWPSLYTLVAIPALPSPLLFLVAVFRPSLIRKHPFLRFYLIACVVAAGLCSLYDIWWLSHLK